MVSFGRLENLIYLTFWSRINEAHPLYLLKILPSLSTSRHVNLSQFIPRSTDRPEVLMEGVYSDEIHRFYDM